MRIIYRYGLPPLVSTSVADRHEVTPTALSFDLCKSEAEF